MEKQRKGKWIVLEGGECSGKSTIAQELSRALKASGQHIWMTREPGGTEAAEEIRKILLKDRNIHSKLDGYTEAYLFAAARNEHLQKVVLPVLKTNKTIIMDRYYYSSLAYQGAGRGLGFDTIAEINRPFIEQYVPDFAFYLKIGRSEQLKRLSKRNSKFVNHLDRETEEFMEKVSQGFDACKVFPEFKEIDAEQDIPTILSQILKIINA